MGSPSHPELAPHCVWPPVGSRDTHLYPWLWSLRVQVDINAASQLQASESYWTSFTFPGQELDSRSRMSTVQGTNRSASHKTQMGSPYVPPHGGEGLGTVLTEESSPKISPFIPPNLCYTLNSREEFLKPRSISFENLHFFLKLHLELFLEASVETCNLTTCHWQLWVQVTAPPEPKLFALPTSASGDWPTGQEHRERRLLFSCRHIQAQQA